MSELKLPAFLTVQPDGVTLAIKLQPRASANEIGEPLALWGTRVSPGTVSGLNAKIYKTIEAWRMKPIEGEHPYFYLDGIALKRSWGGEVRNVAVLVAVGVDQSWLS